MLARIIVWLRKLEDFALIGLLAAMILLAVAQVSLRNIWGGGISWADPMLRMLVLWLALLGAMAATRDRNHINIDALGKILPKAMQNAVAFVIQLFSAVVCALMAWQGGRLVLLDYNEATPAFASIPAWLFELIMPLGFGVMSLRFLLYGIEVLIEKEAP